MTTARFITDAFYGNTKRKECSSVFSDDNGNIYSYGYHYPLLFTVNGKTIRNVRGYSSTTARHILWSRDVDAIDVHAPRGFRLDTYNPEQSYEELVKGQEEYVDSIYRQLIAKKRKDTGVYRALARKYHEAVTNYERLTA